MSEESQSRTEDVRPIEIVEVSDFDEVREAWKCPHLTSMLSGPGEEHFHLGTVMRLDGSEHAFRRKVMGQLLARRGHTLFRERWLFPTADAALNEVLSSPDADGFCRVDLLHWARRVNQQLAAAITGLDGATSPEGAHKLFDLMEIVLRGRPGAFSVTLGQYDESSPDAQAALHAKREIVETFYNPSLARRRELVERVAAGSLAASELPNDLLTLIAQGADPAWLEPAMGEREALFLLSAAVHTTSSSLVWTLQEIFTWIEGCPERLKRLRDEAFILRAAQEALRLHPVVPGFPRGATQDVDLQDGTHIPEGAIAVIRSGPAGTSHEVYGDTALDYDPDRTVAAGINRFGLAFGMGQHMCFGMPIVMGTGGVDGSLVYLLKKVLDAGVSPDPERPTFDVTKTRGRFATDVMGESFPVLFPAPHRLKADTE